MTITLRNVDFETLQVIESLKGLKKDLEIEKIPNDETLEAMKECEEILANPQKYKGYRNVDELFEELLRD
ncbi:hypothetical protein [Helicobacter pullorum]|uniref:Addiction module antitoxin n=1 Tax=Helicobacter pullorum TaxID=35818 RepID=A0A377Q1M2_9HELI|nr:hypothetical protein [Helicobacter pullorum]STQ88785.1 Uncharacterised protein [Helicobacter pullorum]VEJ08541.1 Uncharacterised protein [Helicobacter pullorum]